MNSKKIIIALDNNNFNDCLNLIKLLKNDAFAFKVGYEFFFNFGLEGYKTIHDEGIKIFLDLKLHDIPNTVHKGILAINKLKPFFTTIHISGGDEMQKISNIKRKNTKVLGVTILTSLDNVQTKKYYFNENIEKIVSDYAIYALKNNIDGIVCSPREISIIKKISLDKLIIVTPGIRINNGEKINDDQKRTMSPKEAIEAGSNFLVIGRPITQSNEPLKVLKQINSEIE